MNYVNHRMGAGAPFVQTSHVTGLSSATAVSAQVAFGPGYAPAAPTASYVGVPFVANYVQRPLNAAVFGPGQLPAYTPYAGMAPQLADDGASLLLRYPSFLALLNDYGLRQQLSALVKVSWFAEKFIALADSVTADAFRLFSDSPGVASSYILWLNQLSIQPGQVESLLMEKRWAGLLYVRSSELFCRTPDGIDLLATQPAFPAAFNTLCHISQLYPALGSLVASQPWLMAAARSSITAHLRAVAIGQVMLPVAALPAVPARTVGATSATTLAPGPASPSAAMRPSIFESPVRPRQESPLIDTRAPEPSRRAAARERKRKSRAARDASSVLQ